MIVPAEALQAIDHLQEENLNLQAYEIAKPFGPISAWEGTGALIIGSHLSYALGAVKDASRMLTRAWHRDKASAEATFYYAGELMQRRGPLPTLLFMRKYPAFDGGAKLNAWWYSLLGQVHSSIRDFSVAEQYHKQAVDTLPEDPWVWVSKSYTFEQQDRLDDALEAAMKGLELAPLRRSPVSGAAYYLTLLERNDDALRLLTDVSGKVENAGLTRQLADLQSELGMHAEAYATLSKSSDLLPLLDEDAASSFYASLSDAAYLVGDLDAAIEHGAKASHPFFEKVLENIKAAKPDAKRFQLNVGFLRQHHVTCAPATLSNIARYWKVKAGHLELVEEMCYDGTPSYKERNWADKNGWRTREFTLNWQNATELLERGVPLTLATVHPGGGHLQAIIGFDERRRTFLIRDPYYQRTGEFLADEMLEQQKSNGPRLMALVPDEQRDLLDGLSGDLKDHEIYDKLYEIENAIERHDRQAAGSALSAMDEAYPGHRLSFVARWSLSAYDSNTLGIQAAIKGLLNLFPEDVNLKLNDIGVSAQFTGRTERLEKLEAYATAKATDPLIWQSFGQELSTDARQHKRALQWLFRALRKSPGNGLTYRTIADILWAQRKFDDAVELYRIAASLNDKDENFAWAYFLAMRHLKREDEAISVLTERVERFSSQSGMPARSLFMALRELGRVDEAFSALEAAIAKRPTDGSLYLFAAEANVRLGRIDEADKLVLKADSISTRVELLRTSAIISHLKGDLALAISHWREILSIDPSTFEAHENVAFLTRGLEGAAATKEYLRRVCRKFPTNRSLQILRLQQLDEEPDEAIAVLRDLIRLDPGDIWAHRELSHWYAQVRKLERSLESAEAALLIDPNDGVSHWFRGRALEALGRIDEAAAEYESCVTTFADHTHAIWSWLGLARKVDDKLQVLEKIRTALNAQVTNGDGLFAYREAARRSLDPSDLLGKLSDFRKANARAWFAASAEIQQLLDMGRMEEAERLAVDSTNRFPLVYQIWLDLAQVHKIAGKHEEEIAALKTSVSLNPTWSYGHQQLADAMQRSGHLEEAKHVLESALTRLPFDNFLYGYLADVQWNLNEREAALETVKHAINLEPSYGWAWEAIRRWASQIGRAELPIQLARDLTERKPKDVAAWINLAEMLYSGGFSQDRLDAIETAVSLDPNNATALAIKANCLSEARRFDEAIEVCQTRLPDGHRPEQLQYVEAGIEADRGRIRRAIEILQVLTNSSPAYLPGWARLADYYRTDRGRDSDYLKVARKMVQLSPQDPTTYGYVAEASIRNDRKAEAREALEQAVILDPGYHYAADTLYGLMAEDNDVEGINRLVGLLSRTSKEIGLPMALELAAKEEDRDKVIAVLHDLFQLPDIHKEKTDAAFERVTSLFGKKNDRVLQEELQKICRTEGANPLAASYLIAEIWEKDGKSGCEKELAALSTDQKMWSKAAVRYLEILSAEKPAAVSKFIDANSSALAESTESWASVGYLLVGQYDLEKTSAWFQGWEGREGVMPWMLWNYALTLRRSSAMDGADKINEAALNLPHDDTVALHLTSLGISAFIHRDIDRAQALFSNINSMGMGPYDQFFFDLLQDGLSAATEVQNGNVDGAKAIVSGMVRNVRAFDPRLSDVIVRYSFNGVLDVTLGLIDSTLYKLWTKIKLSYSGLG